MLIEVYLDWLISNLLYTGSSTELGWHTPESKFATSFETEERTCTVSVHGVCIVCVMHVYMCVYDFMCVYELN